MQSAEQKYWYCVVRDYMDKQEDWRYLDEATLGLLKGKVNQDYITDEIEYPVLRWRQLENDKAEAI